MEQTQCIECEYYTVTGSFARFLVSSCTNWTTQKYSIPPLIEYPLIEYSNILNTEVVHGLGSVPKLSNLKGVFNSTY